MPAFKKLYDGLGSRDRPVHAVTTLAPVACPPGVAT